MMTEVDFSNYKSAEKWFQKQSVEVRCALASRAALRVFCNVYPINEEPSHLVLFFPDSLVLSCMRAILVSAARGAGEEKQLDWSTIAKSAANDAALYAAISPEPNTKSAIHSARNAARAALLFVYSAGSRSINSATRSTIGSDADKFSANSSAISDLQRITTLGETDNLTLKLYSEPVWNNVTVPKKIAANHIALLNWLKQEPKWQFWHEWYLAMWEGKFQNWGLAFELIKIPDEIWERGAEAVATEIERIQAKHFTIQHPLAETIQLNPETNRFYTTPTPVRNAPLIGALLSRVQDSIEDATLGKNGLNEQSREVRVLNRTLSRYSNDPQRVEMDFTSVAVGLRRQIYDTSELPNSEDNLALLEAVEDGVRGIRAAHPDVAENRLILAQQSMRELPQDKIELLEDALPMLVAMSEDVMAEDFAADIPALINDALLPLPNGAPPLAGADKATRIFNRVAHMQLKYDPFVDAGSKALDSKTFKTARFGFTVYSMLNTLMTIGRWVFGVI